MWCCCILIRVVRRTASTRQRDWQLFVQLWRTPTSKPTSPPTETNKGSVTWRHVNLAEVSGLIENTHIQKTQLYSIVLGQIYLSQEALLLQRGRAMLHVCIASIQNVECSLLLLVVSASDIPLRTIKFFSVLFSSAYSSMLQAVRNKHSLVCRRLCDVHRMVVGKCFWHFAHPAIFDSQLLNQIRDFCLYPTCIRRPRKGGSRRNIATSFDMEKL